MLTNDMKVNAFQLTIIIVRHDLGEPATDTVLNFCRALKNLQAIHNTNRFLVKSCL